MSFVNQDGSIRALTQSYSINDTSNKVAPCAFVANTMNSTISLIDSSLNSLTSALNLKANKTYVDASLNIRATQSYVDASLNIRATQSYVDASLNIRATKSYVDASLNLINDSISIIDASLNALFTDISGLSSGGSSSSGITLDDAVLQIEIEGMRDLPVFAQNWMLNANSNSIYNGNGNYSNCIATSGNGQYIFIGLHGTSNTVFPKLSNDYGNTWTTVTAPVNYDFMNATTCAISATGQYMVSYNHTVSTSYFDSIYYSSTYGKTWIRPNGGVGSTTSVIYSVAISSTGKYMLSGSYNNLVLSSDYGETWNGNVNYQSDNNTFNTQYRYVTMSHDGSIMYACTKTKVYKSTDFGVTWSISNTSGANNGHISCSANGQYVLICTLNDVFSNSFSAGPLYVSNDYGVTFTSVGTSLYYSRCSISACGRYMVASDGGHYSGPMNIIKGYIYASDDYGQTWNQVNNTIGFYSGIAMNHIGTMIYCHSTQSSYGSSLYVSNANYSSCIQTSAPYGSVPAGTIYYDQSSNKLQIYNGKSSAWYSIGFTPS